MDEVSLKENHVVFESNQGLQVTGSVAQLGRHEIVFEIYSPTAVIQASEAFKNFQVQLGGQTAYSGRAVVKSVVHTGTKVVCSVALDDPLQLQLSADDLQPAKLQALYREHMRQWQKLSLIRSEFKLQVADMENYFAELRLWLDQLELGIRSSSDNPQPILNNVAMHLGTSILPTMDALFQKFEHLAESLDPAARPAHRTYVQRRLHPLLLCAPFAHRTFSKPLGYAGDYEMVNMIARNSAEGESLYAQVVNLWFIRQAPAEAHRNRLTYLSQRLLEETARVASEGRPARIYSIACGPAVEIQNFLREQEASNRAELSLLDFNEETLQYVGERLNEAKTKFGRRTPVQFVKRSVHQLIKDSARTAPTPSTQQYDFVYCAGLFDYLADAVCQRLMTLLYDWVAPGGLLLATNVEPSNPMRQVMEHVLDWQLIYRSGPQTHALRPSQVPPEDYIVTTDITGVNIFMESRKPRHG